MAEVDDKKRLIANYNIHLPDNAGAYKINVIDSDGVTVLSIDSDGHIYPADVKPTGNIALLAGNKIEFNGIGSTDYITYNATSGYLAFVVGGVQVFQVRVGTLDSNKDVAVADGLKILLNGASGDTYLVYDSGNGYISVFSGGSEVARFNDSGDLDLLGVVNESAL